MELLLSVYHTPLHNEFVIECVPYSFTQWIRCGICTILLYTMDLLLSVYHTPLHNGFVVECVPYSFTQWICY